MDGPTFKALRVARRYTQQSVADVMGVDRSFVAQIEGESRPLPEHFLEAAERLLAAGEPRTARDSLLYVLARFRASGRFVLPRPPYVFVSRELADGAVNHLRRNGYPGATVIPTWPNGGGDIAEMTDQELSLDVTPADKRLVRELVRAFTATKQLP